MKKAFLGLAFVAALLVSCKDTKTTTDENKVDSLETTVTDTPTGDITDSETVTTEEVKVEDSKTTELAKPTEAKK